MSGLKTIIMLQLQKTEKRRKTIVQFGIKTTVPSNQVLSNGYTLFQWITRKKDVPRFWLRNLTGKDAIKEDEILFLKEKNCKVGFFLNDFSEREIATNDGTEAALRAIKAAIALNIPRYAGIAIFIIVPKTWNINHNWMISFSRRLCEKGFIPGFMGNTDSSKNFSFDRECGHFLNATHSVTHYRAVFGATEPCTHSLQNGWTPFAPSDLTPDQIVLWCNDEPITFREIISEPVYAKDKSVFNHFLAI